MIFALIEVIERYGEQLMAVAAVVVVALEAICIASLDDALS